MKIVNARVVEAGLPRLAYYLGTHVSGSKHYVEIRYGQRQSRKWMPASKVRIDEGVTLVYCEKVAELGNKEGRKVSVVPGGAG